MNVFVQSKLLNLIQIFGLSFALQFTVLSAGVLHAQEVLKERPYDTRVVQSGHSLTDPIPEMLQKLLRASGVRGAVVDRSTIPGSTLDWRWVNAPGYGEPDARADIGEYDLLVTTERVSLSGTMPWHNSDEETLRWFDNTWTNGNAGKGAETILYATWVNIESGPDFENPFGDPEGHIPFRQRLMLEMDRWEQIKDHVNTNRPTGSPPMQLIPGPLIMAEVYDKISAGQAPGFSSISDVFFDSIHLNSKGSYLIALAHYMVIYGQDPRGLPHSLGQETPPSKEQAVWMQELVWRVVMDYLSQSS